MINKLQYKLGARCKGMCVWCNKNDECYQSNLVIEKMKESGLKIENIFKNNSLQK